MEKNGAVTSQTPTANTETQKTADGRCCGNCRCYPQFPQNDQEAEAFIGDDVLGHLAQSAVKQAASLFRK